MHAIANHKGAVNLMMEGALALSKIQSNGIKMDMEYLFGAETKLKRLTADEMAHFLSLDDVKYWKRWAAKEGLEFNPGSDDQLAHILFKFKKYKVVKKTATGKPSVDKNVLEEILQDTGCPMIQSLMRLRVLDKAFGTYIQGLLRETNEDGFLRPFFNLHLARTYRSCIAKGTKILVNRGYDQDKLGIPIEEIGAGDLVFCFDDSLRPVLKRVTWAGKTGHREVIRLHFNTGRGRKGYLDCTPEHRIRMADGEYVQAKDVLNYEVARTNNRQPKSRCLSISRWGSDSIIATGHPAMKEHQFVWQQFNTPPSVGFVIHHKDGNHGNHEFFNLEIKEKRCHSRQHTLEKITKNPLKHRIAVSAMHRGRMLTPYKYGVDNALTWSPTKLYLLRLCAVHKASIRQIMCKTGKDHTTLVKAFERNGIDLYQLRCRYNVTGEYLSRWKVKQSLDTVGYTNSLKRFRVDGQKFQRLCNSYGLAISKRVHNHVFTRIEYLNKKVDVYDLEVDECHNFIANGICVHNSSNNPNFQNLPIRDGEIAELIRTAFIPRQDRHLLELDFKGVEVQMAYFYHRDPVMLSFLTDKKKDMHSMAAMKCFLLSADEWNKQTRHAGKNKFVFPEFYGSYWGQVGDNLWKAIALNKLCVGKKNDGISLYDHLKRKDIHNVDDFKQHIKQVEDWFWNDQFTVYNQWKKDWVAEYHRKGYFDSLTGFRYQGILKKNEVINYAVQGSAFHMLLRTLIQLQKWLEKYNMKTLIVGQIHDSLVLDIVPSEMDDVLHEALCIINQDLPKYYPFADVPMTIEAELAPLNSPWLAKKEISLDQYT